MNYRLIAMVVWCVSGSLASGLESVVSSGFQRHDGGEIVLHSMVGIPIVGRSSSSQWHLESGVLGTPAFYHAIINDPPRITSSAEVHAEELELFVYRARAVDPEGGVVTFTFLDTQSFMTVRDSTVSWIPQVADPPLTFRVVASDGFLTDTLTVRVITVTQNQKPSITSATIDTVNEEEPFTYVATAHDPENAPLTFTFTDLPDWIDPVNGIDSNTLSGIPPEASGIATFTLIVDDGRWTDTAWVTLIIRSINNPPVITSPSRVSAIEHQPFEYIATVRDPDDPDPVVWFSHLPPNWVWENERFGQVNGDTLRGVPGEFAGTTFWVYATDGEFTDSLLIEIDLELVEDPPYLTSPNYLKVEPGTSVLYIATAVDPEMQPVTYRFERYPVTWSIPRGDTLQMQIPPFAEFIDSFVVIATDVAGLSDTLTVIVEVVSANEPPQIVSPPRVNATEGVPFVYVVEVDDPDDTLFTFTYLHLPSWLASSLRQGQRGARDSLTGIPGGLVVIDRFTVVVSDGGREPCTLEVIVDIDVTNAPPTILSDPIITTSLGASYTYRVRAVDREGHSFTFSLSAAPERMSINTATGVVSWPDVATNNDSVLVEIQVTDQLGAASTQRFYLHVMRDGRPRCSLPGITNGRGEIPIPLVLSDPDGDTLSIKVFYHTTAGWREIPAGDMAGTLTGILPPAYRDTLIWYSDRTLPGVKTTTRIQIIPSDPSSTGDAVASNPFTVDNTPFTVLYNEFPSRGSVVHTWECRTIGLRTSGPPLDRTTINRNTTRVSDRHGNRIALDTTLVTDTSLTFVLASALTASDTITVALLEGARDTTGKGIEEPFEWSFSVAWLGDFTKDGTVDYRDLGELAQNWYAFANGEEIEATLGPAHGEIPFLTPSKHDSAFDYEDLFVFLDMWRYSTALADSVEDPLAKKWNGGRYREQRFDEPRFQTVSVSHSPGQGWRSPVEVTVEGKSLEDVRVAHYRLFYDPDHFIYRGSEDSELLGRNGGEVVALQHLGEGQIVLDMLRLHRTDPSVSGSGVLARFNLERRGIRSSDLFLAYDLLNGENRSIESGTMRITMEGEQGSNRTFRIDSLIAAPNPSSVARTSLKLELRDDPHAVRRASAEEGGFVFAFTVTVPTRSETVADDVRCAVSLVIHDQAGTPVASAASRDIFALRRGGGSESFQSGVYTLYWDGRDSKGGALPRGVYVAVLRWSSEQEQGVLTKRIGIR